MSKLRVGIIGFAQMHVTTMIQSFLALPERFAFIGCADTPSRLRPVSTETGTRLGTRDAVLKACPSLRVFEDYRQLLNERPDLVIVTCENSLHLQVALDALSRSIHVILEKPMAMSLSEAVQMETTARLNRAHLIVNWPTRLDAGLSHGPTFGPRWCSRQSIAFFLYKRRVSGPILIWAKPESSGEKLRMVVSPGAGRRRPCGLSGLRLQPFPLVFGDPRDFGHGSVP